MVDSYILHIDIKTMNIKLSMQTCAWNNLKTKDVRDVLQIGKLATKPETVHFISTTLYKYRPKHREENNE